MISHKPKFKFLERGFKDCLLLIPGWASDSRIFSGLELKFNYLLPFEFRLTDFKQGLFKALRENNLKKVSIFGWSLGSFLAAELSDDCPEIIGDKLFLVSARKSYDRDAVTDLRAQLVKNKKAGLYKFYSEWFSPQENRIRQEFKEGILKEYLNSIELDTLLEGLDYLAAANFNPRGLKNRRVSFIHGSLDKIAPINEAIEIKSGLSEAEFIRVEDAGHLPWIRHWISKD